MSERLKVHAGKMRAKVFRHMLETRGWKYRLFLRQLKLFKYLAFAPTRGAFLECYYTMMRYLDDIVDGDLPLPKGYSSAEKFLSDKIDFSKNPVNPEDETDYLMLWCYELADRFNKDFSDETKDILESLLFDACRKGKLKVFPETELNHHFHRLDIKGTIRATLKVFDDDPDKYMLLEPLGMASRYQFDLEDILTDLEVGYVNISQEECEQFGITHQDLLQRAPPSIKKWMKYRARKGLELLEKHHENLRQNRKEFSLLQKLAFKYVYEKPARKEFNSVINNH